MLF
ncbi:unnamed protein product [Larinioides sclopetarius]|jgi:hypothetical protein